MRLFVFRLQHLKPWGRVAAALLVVMACGVFPPAGSVAASQTSPLVVTSIPPTETIVARIAGEGVRVEAMVPPGASPATYEPRPSQMAKLTEADAYFAVGVPFERAWLERFASANPAIAIVPLDRGIEKRTMAAHSHAHEAHGDHGHGHDHGDHETHGDHGHGHDHGDHETHGDHGHGHDHGAGTPDPHIWLSPRLVEVMAGTILESLSSLYPDRAAQFESNHAAFVEEVRALDAALVEQFAGAPSYARTFMVFHPSWGYFADAYGLRQIAIEMEGKEPGPGELRRLIEEAQRESIRVVFVQPQFSRRAAEVVARELGAEVAVLDPLSPAWFANMRQAAASLLEAGDASGR